MQSKMIDHLLVLGGARSGKSSYALEQAESLGKNRLFLATAQALDKEMEDRIALHRVERGDDWRVLEEPVNIADVLATETDADVILVDCLTLWLSNLMLDDYDLAIETEKLLGALNVCGCPVVMVSNEVGFSLVPESSLGRKFRDAQGLLNQEIAAQVPRVDLVAAGLPLHLKQSS